MSGTRSTKAKQPWVGPDAVTPPPPPGVDERVKVDTNDTTTGFLADKAVAGTNISLAVLNPMGNEQLQINAADPTVKVTNADTTPGNLNSKITAGTNVTKTVLNPGANESLKLDVADPTVKVSSDDTTPGFLSDKLTAGAGVSLTVLNPGANESISIVASDVNVKVSLADTTAGKLNDKIAVGSGLSKSITNPGANEVLTLVADDVNVKATFNDTTAGKLNDKLTVGASLTKTLVNPGANENIRLDLAGAIATIPYESVYIPAGALIPAAVNGPIREVISIPTSLIAVETLRFDDGTSLACYALWPETVQWVDWDDPQFRIRFHTMQITSASGSRFVFKARGGNRLVSDALNVSEATVFGTEVQQQIDGQAQYDLSGGAVSNVNAAIALTLGGTALTPQNSDKVRGLCFKIRRDPGDAGDTFAGSVYLLGISIQFKTDFTSVTQWASAAT